VVGVDRQDEAERLQCLVGRLAVEADAQGAVARLPDAGDGGSATGLERAREQAVTEDPCTVARARSRERERVGSSGRKAVSTVTA
jgi:hypothetical protein